jgi:hypothetical protein
VRPAAPVCHLHPAKPRPTGGYITTRVDTRRTQKRSRFDRVPPTAAERQALRNQLAALRAKRARTDPVDQLAEMADACPECGAAGFVTGRVCAECEHVWNP